MILPRVTELELRALLVLRLPGHVQTRDRVHSRGFHCCVRAPRLAIYWTLTERGDVSPDRSGTHPVPRRARRNRVLRRAPPAHSRIVRGRNGDPDLKEGAWVGNLGCALVFFRPRHLRDCA